jgi:DNA polymerase V
MLGRQRHTRTTGFTSPAEDFFERPLDINDLVVTHPSDTSLFAVGDTSFGELGLLPGDLLLIDQALDATPGCMVWVTIQGMPLIRRLQVEQGRLVLGVTVPGYSSLECSLAADVSLVGVVTAVIRPLLAPPRLAPGGGSRVRVPDLNALLVTNPPATFFAYVEGSSLLQAGIYPGDVLVVDRSLDVSSGVFVIAVLGGRLTIKRLLLEGGKRFVAGGDPSIPAIEVTDQEPLAVWGVVTYAMHSLLRPFPHNSRKAAE